MKKRFFFPLFCFCFIILLCPVNSQAKKINWYNYEKGFIQAKQENKKIFLYFHAKWCSFCKIIDKKTFQRPDIIKDLNDNFISISIDIDKNPDLIAIYGFRSVPHICFTSYNQEIFFQRSGYINTKQFLSIIDYVKKKEG